MRKQKIWMNWKTTGFGEAGTCLLSFWSHWSHGGFWICLLQQRRELGIGEATLTQRNEELNPEHWGLWRIELVGAWRKREFSTGKIREGPGLGETTSRALGQVSKLNRDCEGRVNWQTRLL